MARRDSPIHLVPTAGSLILGGGESDEFHLQKRDYAARWEAAGLALKEVVPPGLDHFAVMDNFTAPGGAIPGRGPPDGGRIGVV